MQPIIVVGLGYGDEGKGSIVDSLVRKHNAKTVIRYNGGSQAAHTVVDPSGATHTFAQFGSGMFVPGVRTHLSRFMKIDPLNMMVENDALRKVGIMDAMERTTIDPEAIVITPFQKLANRCRERARGAGRHGSCGLGIGETQADYEAGYFLTAETLNVPPWLQKDLREIQQYKHTQLRDAGILPPEYEDFFSNEAVIEQLMRDYADFCQSGITLAEQNAVGRALETGPVIFEGAQGILLDETYGFQPYTTWSNTTTENAELLLQRAGSHRPTILGVTRAYMTRHGAGPFVTHDPGLSKLLLDSHNAHGEWQGDFRIGWHDAVMLRYAAKVNYSHIYPTRPRGLDAIAITNLDRWLGPLRYCTHYDIHGLEMPNISLRADPLLTSDLLDAIPKYEDVDDIAARIEQDLATPIMIRSYGPSAGDKQYA